MNGNPLRLISNKFFSVHNQFCPFTSFLLPLEESDLIFLVGVTERGRFERFPFNKKSGLKYPKFRVPNGTFRLHGPNLGDRRFYSRQIQTQKSQTNTEITHELADLIKSL